MKCRLCVVILNYNTAEMTTQCVRSLLSQLDAERDCVVVVDNASSCEERESLQLLLVDVVHTGKLKILFLDENNGFSAGNNAGVRYCDAELYLLANSDTLFLPLAIDKLIECAEAHKNAGVIGPQLEWLNGKSQISCFNYHTPISEFLRSVNTGVFTKILSSYNVPVDPEKVPVKGHKWISFACVLVKAEVFKVAGMLDEKFFMYYEDEDFCRRAVRKGFSCIRTSAARVVHLQGKSSGIEQRISEHKQLPDYYYHSRNRYYLKYYGVIGLLLANACWYAGRFISIGRQLFEKTNSPVPEKEFCNIWKCR